MRQVAVGQPDLTDHLTVWAGEHPPQDLFADQRCKYRGIDGVAEQPKQPHHRIQQVQISRAGDHRRPGRTPTARRHGGLQNERGDFSRLQHHAESERRLIGTDIGVLAGDRQVSGDDEVIPCTVMQFALTV